MHPAVAQLSHHVRESPQLLAPLALSLFATIANVHEPVNYSLSITSVSWALVLVYCLFKVGIRPSTSRRRQNTSWLAGAFIALACVCDRAACDKEGSWAVKGILPILVVLLSRNELLPKLLTLPTHIHDHDDIKHAEDTIEEHPHTRSYYLLTAATVSATVVLACYSASTTTTLSTSGVIFAATGLVLLEIAFRTPEEHQRDALRVPSVEGGTLAVRQSSGELPFQSQLAVYRDFAMTMVIFTSIPACLMESPSGAAASWKPAENGSLQQWRMSHDYRILQWILWTIPINAFTNILILMTMSQHGATNTSLFVLSTYVFAKIRLAASFTTFWFGVVYGSAAFLYMFGTSPHSPFNDTRGSVRLLGRGILGITVVSIGLLMVRFAIEAQQHRIPDTAPSFVPTTPLSPFTTVPVDLSKGHPAMQLIGSAETEFQKKLDQQSKSLANTVREYRRRNGIAPPPHFDKWYEFATRHDVVMIDEFDAINEMLQPFWAIKPATIRSRITRELGGEDSALLGIAIRNGAIVNIDKGDDWQRNATVGMLEKFVQYLPDMDIGFNVYDEPRVVVPTNLLSQMVTKARDEVLPRVAKHINPRNTFSDRPKDMNDGRRFTETYVSNFNRFAHQQTWTQARLSCPTDSQSQNYEDYAPDNVTAYAMGPLGHLYNTTAFSDICISPSLSSTFGFFERPNAFSIIHELTPIFSQSKISSFQDLLYPSPWYWAGRVKYDASEDTDWTNKTNSLYWRGSTTGGFSRNSGWRRQHRQHIVQRLNAPEEATIFVPADQKSNEPSGVSSIKVARRDYKHLVNVHFSHVGQCDPSDCDAQKEFFHVTEHAEPQNAWYFKHLLDMDGNAFSGRFYSFLKSRSLTYKMAIFREWHAEWLTPWVHYIPLSLRGDDHLDLVNWFSGNQGPVEGKKPPEKSGNGDSEGEKKAREIASRSTEWHDKVLRNIDMEVWFFRLLLEYGRIVDDNREEIGYPGP